MQRREFVTLLGGAAAWPLAARAQQPTISRWENAPTLREIIRLTYALVDIWCKSYQKPPRSVVLDIDDTVDVVHGHQQLAQWNAHYDERCFLPISDEPHLVGERRAAAGPIGRQLRLVCLMRFSACPRAQ